MADYGLENQVYALNVAGAKVARRAAEAEMARSPERRRFGIHEVCRAEGRSTHYRRPNRPDGRHMRRPTITR